MPGEILNHPDNSFVTPTEAFTQFEPVGEIDAPHYVSWADVERDLSAWQSNAIQHDALRTLYDMEDDVKRSNDPSLVRDWRRLTTSDHFYYMCTKWFQDGDVHAYFNPYESPYEAYIAYMNVMNDVRLRARAVPTAKRSVWKSISTKTRGVLQALTS
jgi:alpha-amylase